MTKRAAVQFALAALMLVGFSTRLWAADRAKAIAIIVSTKGDAQVKKVGKNWTPSKFGGVLDDNDRIRTGADGFVSVVFTDDKTQLKIRPNSSVTLNGTRDKDYSIAKRVNMDLGELFADVTKQKGTLQVATPTSVASVKGTEFWVIIQDDGQTKLMTVDGIVEFLNVLSGNTVNVTGGTQAVTTPQGQINTQTFTTQDLPTYLEENLNIKTIDIKFTDEEGNEKHLIINYQQDEQGGGN